MNDWFNQMVGNINNAGLDKFEIQLEGGKLLVTQKAARIIACQIDGIDENLFYSGGEIEPGYYGGGDRVWVAPEIAYYWPSLEKAREDAIKWAAVPQNVDPGNYQTADAGSQHVCLQNRDIKLTDGRTNKKIQFDIERFIGRCPRPEGLPDNVTCTSFSITNEIQVSQGDPQAVVGAWDILQVPPRGTLICPLAQPIETPTSYYEDFGDLHVQWDDTAVRYLIDANRRTKMGIPPEATTGRMGYYREIGSTATLIIRIFPSFPGLPYVDQPISNDKDCITGGDVLQAYNDDGNYGPFGEMEYHDPGVVVQGTPNKRSGTSVTHILTGSPDAVKTAGKQILNCEIIPI
ncbi:hypothetical protein KS4_21460 [Poriferisphaera corsica]|uniref:Uncharacterized protein n=1 Tax=Poriferisphaera corsica TaxID=2528020 RepID=A0A517YV43_9BACT|nr:DUF6786 family protein [Poriferisphaera corsica]QDU34084.1 hypothetical protein KS4_21460 [Poriferisphaera corsica]